MQASPRRPQQSLGPRLQIAAEPETAPTLVSPAKTEWDTWRLQLRERVRGHRVVFVALDFVLFLLPTRLAPRLKLTEAPCVSLSLSHLALTSLHVVVKVCRSPLFSGSSLHS